MMFNKIREEITFPEFMEFVNIVCIYKGKGDKMDLNTDKCYEDYLHEDGME